MNEPDLTLDQAQAVVATKTHPKVTEDSIREKITDVSFLWKDQLCVAVVTMRNGFKFVGKSAPASPANFDPKVGERYAYEDAFRQIWSHEGYLLRERLAFFGES